jgi:D-proline reductase (dithiol) PrdB
LVARYLEANGMPTVIVGSARDIVEYCGVPRFLFTDFPLGNPCGPPGRRDLQRVIAGQALDLLGSARAPRTIKRSDVVWPSDDDWRPRYGRVKPEEIERLRTLGEERRERQAQSKKPG